MAGVSMRIDVEDREVRAALGRLLRAGEDMSEALDAIGSGLEANIVDRFETGRGPGGRPWKPSIRVKKTGGQTLVDSGAAGLMGSITRDVGPRHVTVGTNKIYAAIHQFGGTIRAKAGGRLKFFIPGVGFRSPRQVAIPPRPFLGIDDADRAVVADELPKFLRRRWGGAGTGAAA
jgi:phage virion morphogenesis protein